MRCIYCCQDMMELRWDKRGRPYLICAACGVRAFVRSLRAVAAYAVTADLICAQNTQQMLQAISMRESSMVANAAAIRKADKVPAAVVNS